MSVSKIAISSAYWLTPREEECGDKEIYIERDIERNRESERERERAHHIAKLDAIKSFEYSTTSSLSAVIKDVREGLLREGNRLTASTTITLTVGARNRETCLEN